MEERMLFQFVMNSHAYRRIALFVRVVMTALCCGACLGVCAVSVPLGIGLAVIPACFGGVLIITMLTYEETYMVFDTRAVIKMRGKRKDFSLDDMLSVKYKRAFYEKDLACGTIKIRAKDKKGKIRTFAFRHIVGCNDCLAFLREYISKPDSGESRDGENS